VTQLTVAVGADHAGRVLQPVGANAIADAGHIPIVVGPQTGDAIDYPVVAIAVAEALATDVAQRGVVICGSGAGVTVAANKIGGVRNSSGTRQ